MFIENVGQFDEHARFQVHSGNQIIWMAENTIWVTMFEHSPSSSPTPRRKLPGSVGKESVGFTLRRGVNVRLSFVGANPHPNIEPFDRLDTHIAYFIGSNPDNWQTSVPVWGGIRYMNLYPGIDLEMGGTADQLQPRLIVHPGADLSAVRLQIEGADALALVGNYLSLTTNAGNLTLPLLEVSGAPEAEVTSPLLIGNQVLSPFLKSEHHLQTLNNQPLSSSLSFSTFLGGSSGEDSMSISVDGTGAVYVAGSTGSSDFSTTSGAFDPTYNGGYWDGFVAKLSPDTSTLVYSTFLGTGSTEGITAIAVDAAGNAYITGNTMGSSFPITSGAFDSTFNGGSRDAVVTKLNSSGSALLYSTFLGGSGNDLGYALAVDATGATYIAGSTGSSDFPTTPGAFDHTCADCSSDNSFVTKLDVSGSTMGYSAFLGGTDEDSILDLAIDGFGAVYVIGVTSSSNFPTTSNAFDTVFNEGNYDSFVSKLSTDG